MNSLSCSENMKAESREASLGKHSGDAEQRKERAWGCLRWGEAPGWVTPPTTSTSFPSGLPGDQLSLRLKSVATFSRATH